VPKNEDGEFELILGNRQLLSVFFVVAILFGVFFVLGYVVGRNSTPLVNAEPANARKSDTKPPVDSPASTQAPASSADTSSAPESPKPVETAVQKPVEARPEPPPAEPTKPSTSKSEPAAKRDVAKVEKARPAPPPSRPAQNDQPIPGETYLQLLATSNKHDADLEVDALRKNGFPSLVAEIAEKPGWVRVLVGPLSPGELNKTKDDLKSKGIQASGAIPKRY
jgi:cell division septation protein DedD